jgi:hypothetical protein
MASPTPGLEGRDEGKRSSLFAAKLPNKSHSTAQSVPDRSHYEQRWIMEQLEDCEDRLQSQQVRQIHERETSGISKREIG